jgi:hypothetical protein
MDRGGHYYYDFYYSYYDYFFTREKNKTYGWIEEEGLNRADGELKGQ